MRTLTALLITLAVTSPAHALGKLGHRVVGELAEPQLKAEAKAAVADLLSGEPEPSLAGVANWADELRGNDPVLGKRSAPWHYLNFARPKSGQALTSCHYLAERDCPNGNCVVAAIQQQLHVLADRSQPRQTRQQALKFVVHFVADVHQPLHAGYGDDKGGNTYQLRYRGEGTNLHGVWDYWLLNTAGFSDAKAYADALRTRPALPADATSAQPDRVARWAEESCRVVGSPGFYPAKGKLDEGYVERQRPVLETRLREAGDRLARLLNESLRH